MASPALLLGKHREVGDAIGEVDTEVGERRDFPPVPAARGHRYPPYHAIGGGSRIHESDGVVGFGPRRDELDVPTRARLALRCFGGLGSSRASIMIPGS